MLASTDEGCLKSEKTTYVRDCDGLNEGRQGQHRTLHKLMVNLKAYFSGWHAEQKLYSHVVSLTRILAKCNKCGIYAVPAVFGLSWRLEYRRK